MHYKDLYNLPKAPDGSPGKSSVYALLASQMKKNGTRVNVAQFAAAFPSRFKNIPVVAHQDFFDAATMRSYLLDRESLPNVARRFSMDAEQEAALVKAWEADCGTWRKNLCDVMRAPEGNDLFLHALAMYHNYSSATDLLEKIYRDLKVSKPIHVFTGVILTKLRKGGALSDSVAEAIRTRCPLPEGIVAPAEIDPKGGGPALPVQEGFAAYAKEDTQERRR